MNWPAIARTCWIRFRPLRSPADSSSGSPLCTTSGRRRIRRSSNGKRKQSPPAGPEIASMRKPIVIFTIGTQGDVRPCVALGQGLQRAGYPVRIATSGNFAELVRQAGLEFYPMTADFQAMLDADRSIADHGMNLREMARIFRERYTKWAASWVKEGLAASEGAGLLIGVSNSILLAKALSRGAVDSVRHR